MERKNIGNYKKQYSEEDRTIVCEWCSKKFKVSPYKIKITRFCSKECRREWHSKVFTQTEEWKEASSIRATKLLEDGTMKKDNKLQEKINNMLNNMGIEFINEKTFGYFNVDNYLNEYNLIIEVMGSFWHCDHRVYKEINYEAQLKRIKKDKVKHDFIKNNYGIEILYLWEEDINKNYDNCVDLIKKYISNEGTITEYHSFNNVGVDKTVPFMEWAIEKLNTVVDIKNKIKISHKQKEKWIEFNCDCCGKKREELFSHYVKWEKHYCSKECAGKGQIDRVKTSCAHCGKELYIIKSISKKGRTPFCDSGCKKEYFKSRKTPPKKIIFLCQWCGEEATQNIGDYNKAKNHFCSKKCSALYFHSNKK